ncbi:T9SS type A sorting domain-containing protein [Aquimarina sediminis]|uniref:T9SS type A sorting domain-containing protein n=1 Tax=Aquimarina sediminis TaxID=2070536 RepID=UPI000CA08C00|nr:T9SS type A sorting domain-containing protein [Aquimarina sediminis]
MNRSKLWGILLIALCVMHYGYAYQSTELSCDRKIQLFKTYYPYLNSYPSEVIIQMQEWIAPCATNANDLFLRYLEALAKLESNNAATISEGLNLMAKVAKDGSIDAMNKMGIINLTGQYGRPINRYIAEYYFIQVLRGDRDPQNDLANYCMGYIKMKGFNSTDYRKNDESAKIYFSRSNHPMAKHWLAIFNYFGYGGAKDQQKAIQILSANDILNSRTLLAYLPTQNTDWIQIPAEEYQAVRYFVNQHPTVYTPDFNKISTTYQGKFVEFDWALNGIKRYTPFSLTLDIENTTAYAKTVRYQFSINGHTTSGTGQITNNIIKFDQNFTFPLKRLYKDNPNKENITYKISELRFKETTIDNTPVLVVRIDRASILDFDNEPMIHLRMIMQENIPSPTIASTSVVHSDKQKEDVLKKIDKDFAVISPNPIGNEFTITYTLKEPAEIQVSIYDFFGQQKISVPSKKNTDVGTQTMKINSASLPSGTYVIQMTIDGIPYSKTVVKL